MIGYAVGKAGFGQGICFWSQTLTGPADRWWEGLHQPRGEPPWKGILKRSFVSEPAIRLQLFVPVSPRAGGLSIDRVGKPEAQRLQIQEAKYIVPET